MARAELGTKYTCSECGSKFYDLNNPPPTCPKCKFVITIEQPEVEEEILVKDKKSTEVQQKDEQEEVKKEEDDKIVVGDDVLDLDVEDLSEITEDIDDIVDDEDDDGEVVSTLVSTNVAKKDEEEL